jgi:hypothetical protein
VRFEVTTFAQVIINSTTIRSRRTTPLSVIIKGNSYINNKLILLVYLGCFIYVFDKCIFDVFQRGRTGIIYALDKTNGHLPLDVFSFLLKNGSYLPDRDHVIISL